MGMFLRNRRSMGLWWVIKWGPTRMGKCQKRGSITGRFPTTFTYGNAPWDQNELSKNLICLIDVVVCNNVRCVMSLWQFVQDWLIQLAMFTLPINSCSQITLFQMEDGHIRYAVCCRSILNSDWHSFIDLETLH